MGAAIQGSYTAFTQDFQRPRKCARKNSMSTTQKRAVGRPLNSSQMYNVDFAVLPRLKKGETT